MNRQHDWFGLEAATGAHLQLLFLSETDEEQPNNGFIWIIWIYLLYSDLYTICPIELKTIA